MILPVLDLSPRLTVAPSVVITNRLLACGSLELPQQLLLEVADNPLLQLLPAQACPRCGFPLDEARVCALCARRPAIPFALGQSLNLRPSRSHNQEEYLPAPVNFRSDLLTQARLALGRADHSLAEFIIYALDDNGLLSGPTAATLPQRAERVLRAIQSLDPPGIAARSTAECFRLQLGRLDCPVPHAVHSLIERWPNLPEHRETLARILKISLDELNEAVTFMRAHLRPYPVMDSPDALPHRRVDVAILPAHNPEGSLEVIVAPGPRVRPGDDPAGLGRADFSLDDWRALAQRGLVINHALLQRERMIQWVFAQVASRQAAFLREGLRCHQPLTRAEIARAVGVHASTVGRAAADKLVLVPSGQIVPAALFFERGAAIKHAIREIVAQSAVPLTDEQLRERLAEKKIVIARRTVAKYRAAAGVLPAHLQWGQR